MLLHSSNSINRQYLTSDNEVKTSSLIRLHPHSSFVTKENTQSDLYLIHGNIKIQKEVYPSGTYCSTGKSQEFKTNETGAYIFLYEEPSLGFDLEIMSTPLDQKWMTNSIQGMRQTKLRTITHDVFLVSWDANTKVPFHIHPKGEEIFVLQGELLNGINRIKKDEWIRMPPNTGHAPYTKEKTLILLRNGHL